MCGKKKYQVPAVHECLVIDPNSLHEWGIYHSLPALCEKRCEGKGKHNAIDGGLACYSCHTMRRKNGNSNPARWVTKCYCEMIRVQEIRNRPSITPIDFKETQSFLKNNKSRFAADGLTLCNEIQSMHEYLKETIHLNNRINTKKEIVIESN